jgi:cytochrome c
MLAFRSRVGALALVAVASSAANAQDVAQGGKLAEKYCSRCHAVGTSGTSPHLSAPPFRVIAAKGHVDDLQEALAEGITVGHPDMPEFAFEPTQISDFLAYLKGLAPSTK